MPSFSLLFCDFVICQATDENVAKVLIADESASSAGLRLHK